METLSAEKAVSILESKLLTRCTYYNQYLDCDKCQRADKCQAAWDRFINSIECRKVQSSFIDRAFRKFENVL